MKVYAFILHPTGQHKRKVRIFNSSKIWNHPFVSFWLFPTSICNMGNLTCSSSPLQPNLYDNIFKTLKATSKSTACILKFENPSLVRAHTKKSQESHDNIKLNSWHCNEVQNPKPQKGSSDQVDKYHKHGEKIRALTQHIVRTSWKSFRNPTENYNPHKTQTTVIFS